MSGESIVAAVEAATDELDIIPGALFSDHADRVIAVLAWRTARSPPL